MARTMGPAGMFLSSERNNTTYQTREYPSRYSPTGNITVNHITHYTTQIRHHSNYNSYQSTAPPPFYSPQPHPRLSDMAQSLIPTPPRIPAPGRMIVCDAILPHNEGCFNAPALCYASVDDGWYHVYPFMRWMIGDVWHTRRDMSDVELQAVDDPTLAHVATRADLPSPMIRQLVTALEQHGGGARPDSFRVCCCQSAVFDMYQNARCPLTRGQDAVKH